MSNEKPLVEAVERLPRLMNKWDSEGIWDSREALEDWTWEEFGPVLTRFQAISDEQIIVHEPGLKYITGWCWDDDQQGTVETWIFGVAR